MTTQHIYLPDETWDSGYHLFLYTPTEEEEAEVQEIRWPLPHNRVYEVVHLGDTHFILRRASDVIPEANPEREGEQS